MRIHSRAPRVLLSVAVFGCLFPWQTPARAAGEKAATWSIWAGSKPPAQEPPILRTPSTWHPGVLIPPGAPDIQIFPSANPQTEVSIAVNTANPLNLLVTSNTVPSDLGQGYYYSLNGGQTWAGSDLFPVSAPNYGDPVALFDGAGTAYDVSLSTGDGVVMTKSFNGGVTWIPAVNIDPSRSFADKEHAAADHSPGSPFLNSFYCAWTDFGSSPERVVLVTSRNNFANRKTLDAALPGDFGQGVNLSVGPGGEVYAVWAYYSAGFLPEAGLGFCRSLDGGTTWTPAGVAFGYQGIRTSNGPNALFNNIRVNSFPWSAVDISTGSHRGRLYVVYTDNSLGDADIYLRHSDDQGTSWSPALRVNSDAAGNGHQQWFPSVAVDPITGDVSVAWYSIDTPATFATNYWVGHSANGGATFETFPVSDVAHVPQELGSPFSAGYAGDYYGIAAYDGRAWPAWSDNRTGTYNIYVQTIVYADPKDPRPPVNVTASSDYTTPDRIDLSWTDPTQLTDGTALTLFDIEVRRDGAVLDTVPAGQQSLTDTGLTDGQLYTYSLRARDATTDSLSIVVSLGHHAGGDPVPGPPEAFSVAALSGAMELHWRNPVSQRDGTPLDDFAGIKIYRNGNLLAMLTRAPGDTGASETYPDPSPVPGQNCYQVAAFDNESPVNDSAPTAAICVETPLVPPFSDPFPQSGPPNPALWVVNGTVIDVNTRSAGPPSPPYACDFLGTCDLTSKPIDLSGLERQNYVLLYYKEQTGNGESPDPGNDLYLEFLTSTGAWDPITVHLGSTPDEQQFTRQLFSMDSLVPSSGTYFHSQFRFRFRATGDDGFDDWFIDNVALDQADCAPTAAVIPAAVADSLVSGDPNPDRVDLSLGNSCDFVSLTWSAAVSPAVSWLTLTGTGGTIVGTGSATIQASFSAAALPVGSYQTEILISSNDPVNPVLHVPVTLIALPAPDIDVSPPALTFSSPRDGLPLAGTVIVRNTGASPLAFQVSDNEISLDQPGVHPPAGPVTGTGTVSGPAEGTGLNRDEKVPPDSGADDHRPPQPFSRGGPDAANYSWKDSDEPGGPVFNWFDITTVGTNLNLCCDDVTQTGVPIGFSMPFYGALYSTVNICTNGFLSFTSGSASLSNTTLPNPSAPPNLIAALWSDLYLGSSGASIYVYQDVAGRRFIVQYNHLSYCCGTFEDFNFQIILEESGRVLLQYLTLAPAPVGPTVGIQNGDGTIGLQVAYSQSYLHDNLAVAFSQDASWLSVIPPSGVVAPGDSIALTATVLPAGLSLGPHQAEILVASNDLDEPSVSVDVHLDITGMGEPLPFCDAFNAGSTPDPSRWTNSGVALDGVGLNEPSPLQSAHLNGTDRLTSVYLNLGGQQAAGLGFRYYLEKTGGGEPPDEGNDLIVEFRNSNGVWDTVARHEGGNLPNMNSYALNLIDIESLVPSSGTYFHPLFLVRFRTTGDFGSDDWFVDDVCLDDFFCRPTLSVQPLALADTLNVGTGGAPKALEVANGCETSLLSFSIVPIPPVSWLSLEPASGLIPGIGTTVVQAAFNSLGLAPGSYQTTLHLTSNDALQPQVLIPVDLVVAPEARGSIWPDTLRAATWVGGPAREGTAEIASFGGGVLGWRVIDYPAAASLNVPEPNPVKLKIFGEFADLPDRIIETGAVKELLEDGNYPKGYNEPAAGPHIQPYALGGPDAFGYRWIDSDDPYGPDFEWVELDGHGGIDAIVRNDDQNRGPFPIGFHFPFYGAIYDSMRFCSNGWISPTSNAIAWTNTAFPNATLPNNTIAPLWDDLKPGPQSKVFYRSDAAEGRFVVEYRRFIPYNAPQDTLTFQVILWRDGSLQFNYLFLGGMPNSASIGIENAAGTTGLTVVFDQVYAHSGLTVLIYPDAPWITTAPSTGSVIPGGFSDVQVGFDPAGLVPGLHRAWLRFLTDDPHRPRLFVATEFEVDASPKAEACPDCPASVQEVPIESGAATLLFPFCNCSPVAGLFRWSTNDTAGWIPAQMESATLGPGECAVKTVHLVLPASAAAGDTNVVYVTTWPDGSPQRRHTCRVVIPVISSPTPVKLAEFTAQSSPDGVEIAWSTVSETDHDYFDLLRSPDSASPEFVRLNPEPLRGDRRFVFLDPGVEEGRTYRYRIEAVDRTGQRLPAGELTITADLQPRVLSLGRNYPNPFHDATRLHLDLPRQADVSLRVFDSSGRLVRTLLADEILPAGRHEVAWNRLDDSGRPVAHGFYFLKLESPEGTRSIRMVVK